MKLHQAMILGLALLGAMPAAQAATHSQAMEKTAGHPPRMQKAATKVVHLNKADIGELQTLKGVGPKTARAILAWRKQSGPFKSVDQLLAVKGIGAKTLAKMRDQLAL